VNDPDTPSRRNSPPALRLAATSSANGAQAAAAPAEGPLVAIVEALQDAAADRGAIAEVVRQRLGDARTLGLLAQGDCARGVAALLVATLREAGDAVRRSLADHPDDAAGRLACVRAAIRFGQVLVAQGLLAPRRLEPALAAQQSSGRRLGEELVAEGQISAREVAEALWLQHKLRAAALALLLLPGREAAAPRLVHSTRD